MEITKLNFKKLVPLALLAMSFTLIGITSCFAQLPPSAPEDDNAMWFDPMEVYVADTSPIGYKFNLTLWTKTVNSTKGWQIRLWYSNTYINFSRAGLTAGAKSDFYHNLTYTFPVTPSHVVENTSHNRLDYGEAAPGPPLNPELRGPGYGSLCWVEFEVIAALPTYVEIPLDIEYAYTTLPPLTYLLYSDDSKSPLVIYNGLVIVPELSSLLILGGLLALATPIVFHSRKKIG